VLRALSTVNFDRLLPPDDEARARRSARLRWVGMSCATVVLVGVTIYAVFPVRTWMNLRASTDRARERLEAFQHENALLEEEERALRDDERIEQEARELGLVLPGEESYRILPAPQAPPTSTSTTVPEG
jgi:cell division protein FtsB